MMETFEVVADTVTFIYEADSAEDAELMAEQDLGDIAFSWGRVSVR